MLGLALKLHRGHLHFEAVLWAPKMIYKIHQEVILIIL